MRAAQAITNICLSAMIAGCINIPTEDGKAPTPDAPVEWKPSQWQAAVNANGQREAVVSVSKAGDVILSCMHGDFAAPISALVSQDAGLTWTSLALPSDAPPAGDCATTIFDDGRWAFAASSRQGASTYVTSDGGKTWTSNHQVAVGAYVGGPIFNVDRPWIHAVGEDLWFTWMPGKDVPGTVMARVSSDGGLTWTDPAPVGLPAADSTNVRHAQPVDYGGRVYVAMMRYQVVRDETVLTGQRALEIASSADGVTWEVERVLTDKRIIPDWPSLAITQSGHMVLMFTYQLESGSRGIAAISKQPEGLWGDPFEVHDPGEAESSWPWIDGGVGNRTTFIVHGAEIGGQKRIWLGSMDAATQDWSIWPVGEGLVEFASVDHTEAGTAWAAWTISDDAQFVARLEPSPSVRVS